MKKLFLTIFMIILLSFSALAFSTISVSKIDFSSNDVDVDGPAFLISGVDNHGNDELVYSQQLVSSSQSSSEKVTIKTDIKNYRVEYPIRFSDVIYRLDNALGEGKYYITVPFVDRSSDCFNKGGSFIYKDKYSFTEYCYKFVNVGVRGEIENANSKYDITVSVTGKSGTDSVTSVNGASVVSAREKVFYRSEGLLNSGIQVPSLDGNYDVYYKGGQQNLVDKSAWNNYRVSYDNLMNQINSKNYDSSFAGLISKINQQVSNFEIVKPYSNYNYQIKGGVSDGVVVITPPETSLFEYPLFTLKVNAEWVGIIRNVGKPVIVSASQYNNCFAEGTQGRIDLKVRNDGEQSTFQAETTCDTHFNTLNINRFSIAKGQTYSLSIPLTGETENKLTGQCWIKVSDINNPIQVSEKGVSVCVTNAVQCPTLGQKSCIDGNVVVCQKNNGVNVWNLDTACQNGCDSGVCIQKDGSGTSTNDSLKTFFTVLFLAIILSTIITLIIVKNLPEFKMRWLVGIIIGIIIFVILFFVMAWIVKIVLGISGWMSS